MVYERACVSLSDIAVRLLLDHRGERHDALPSETLCGVKRDLIVSRETYEAVTSR
jgi:hypothetical protein